MWLKGSLAAVAAPPPLVPIYTIRHVRSVTNGDRLTLGSVWKNNRQKLKNI